MKKKIIFTAVIISVLLICSTVLALEIIGKNNGRLDNVSDIKMQVVTVTADNNTPLIKTVENNERILTNFPDRFAGLIATYSMPIDQQEYLAGLIEQGYDANWLAEIYEFWTDCCEDITIIKDIYDISVEKEYCDKYWIEEAYNDATDDVHGVLDNDAVSKYLYEYHLTPSDIIKANILSRKGDFTIQELLQKILDGEDIDELYAQNTAKTQKEISSVNSGIFDTKQKTMRVVQYEPPERNINNDQAIDNFINNELGEDIVNYYKSEGCSIYIIYNAYMLSQQTGSNLNPIISDYINYRVNDRLLTKVVDLR